MSDEFTIPEHLRLQAILDNAVDAIVTIDDKGMIETANPATTILFQYTYRELIGHNVSMLMPSPFREEHDNYLRNYLASGIGKIIGIGREVVGRRKDGSEFPIHLAVNEVTFEGRRIFSGIVRDISDLKNARMELEQLNSELEDRVKRKTNELRLAQAELVTKEKLATLGQVAGGIAHEIRNPLNALRTSVYYLKHAKQPSPEKQLEHLERIDRQVTMINNVVTALSEIARMPEASVSPVSPELLLRTTLAEIELPASINVIWDMAETIGHMMADEQQIHIVFRNIIRNARDAMPKGGTLTLSVKRSVGLLPQHAGDCICVTINDTGQGIEPQHLVRITEPLFSTKARGMGLGLAICKSIIDKNQGRMDVESNVGVGSSFTVMLPAQAK